MEKLRFALEIEEDWPPVATESVWCERIGDAYRLLNAPFFISGLAYGDTFIATVDPVNGCVFEHQLVEASGHSLVWVLNNDALDFREARQGLLDLGCSIEGLPAFQLQAIDVPTGVDVTAINAAVGRLEELGLALAFPVWRHEGYEA